MRGRNILEILGEIIKRFNDYLNGYDGEGRIWVNSKDPSLATYYRFVINKKRIGKIDMENVFNKKSARVSGWANDSKKKKYI